MSVQQCHDSIDPSIVKFVHAVSQSDNFMTLNPNPFSHAFVQTSAFRYFFLSVRSCPSKWVHLLTHAVHCPVKINFV